MEEVLVVAEVEEVGARVEEGEVRMAMTQATTTISLTTREKTETKRSHRANLSLQNPRQV